MALDLYMYPASVTSRPIRLLSAMHRLPVVEHVVDIVTGEHYRDEFTSLNPNRQVPVLVDGELRLTESATILRYLATRFPLPEYPIDLAARAKVDEALDWFNTQLARAFLYDLVYPQILPHHQRASEDHQQATLAWGLERARGWLEILDQHLLGARSHVVGDRVTIADLFGGAIVSAGAMIGCRFAAFPNVRRWLRSLEELASWAEINGPLCRFAAQLQGRSFVAL